jgi:hypothetical protein
MQMEQVQQNKSLNVDEAGDYLRLKSPRWTTCAGQHALDNMRWTTCAGQHALDNMRWKGKSPSFRKHGERIFYHIEQPLDLQTLYPFKMRQRDDHGTR